jgi:Peptidase family C78
MPSGHSFNKTCLIDRCIVHDFDLETPPFVNSLITYVEDYFKLPKSSHERPSATPHCTISDRAPLYFQHSGHSRTIVGVERLKSGTVNFLIFDPSKKPSSRAKNFGRASATASTDVLKPYRLSARELSKKTKYSVLRCDPTFWDGVLTVVCKRE